MGNQFARPFRLNHYEKKEQKKTTIYRLLCGDLRLTHTLTKTHNTSRANANKRAIATHVIYVAYTSRCLTKWCAARYYSIRTPHLKTPSNRLGYLIIARVNGAFDGQPQNRYTRKRCYTSNHRNRASD